jgi:hypothetical protein
MKNSIKKILKESEEWFDSVSNDFANTELPFEVIGLRNRPAIKNMFIINSTWDDGDRTLREEYHFKSDNNESFQTFINVCKFYSTLLSSNDTERWQDVDRIVKSIGLSISSYDEDDNYGTPKDMSDYCLGQDYPAVLYSVQISYYDESGVEHDVKLK